MTPMGIEPATFRFVQQCLNQYQYDSRKKFKTVTFIFYGLKCLMSRNSDNNNVKGRPWLTCLVMVK